MSAADSRPEVAFPGPLEILRLDAADADRLLDRLEADVPTHRGAIAVDLVGAVEAIVVGDIHGDWRSAEAAAQLFLEAPHQRLFVGLGDYVDRAPDDCGEGSVATALYLLGLAARYPDRVTLLRGNHEMNRVIPVLPHDLPSELDALWGPDPDRYTRIESLFARGPLAATTAGGAYFAHAGFLKDPAPDWAQRLEKPGEEEVLALTWSECTESRVHRGVPRFSTADLANFGQATGTSLFLRGHDPDLNGRWSCGDRCLTIHTSRIYERYGGVLCARLALDGAADRKAVRIEHLTTEGQEFDPP